ncbi:A24 family peptidase C-terminal domain-containing protein [Archaeoglobus sulfaticallidus]|nr:A24 family peptidase C-terminal domain-containing protein [Archaeoglobus sulfaticallidus]
MAAMLEIITLVKIILAMIFLLYACVLDLRYRIVPNRLWKYMVAVLTPILVLEFVTAKYSLSTIIFSVMQFVMMFVFSYLLYSLGTYGGADAKAFIVMAYIFPVYPAVMGLPLLNKGFGIFAFSVLSNSVIVSPALLIITFIRNLRREGLRDLKGNFLYYFVGKRVKANSIPEFHSVLEFVDDSGKIVRVRRGIEVDEKVRKKLMKAYDEGIIDRVWVTPNLPFLLFITAGFIISVVIGDILYLILSLILH